ncbi:MAG: type II toxin-antitoxin system HipA family toxin [Treponema sp.]|nr:type II toxin-antitoxin system HipA family toxin [Treponema sp.]
MSRELNVYLCGNKIGVLTENELSQFSFRYNNTALQPLSVNLPVRTEEYPHSLIYPFFENLAPEGEIFEILTREHISGSKIFSILDRFGGDCAGAVAFYKTTPENNTDNILYEITSDKILQIIEKLPDDPLLTSIKNPPRLSLAGAQSKFAVYKLNGKYYRSDDKHPTTHIIKIANKRFPELLKNELFCMKLAQAIKMDIPDIKLQTFTNRSAAGTVSFLEIKRFDRVIKDRSVQRVHQEDFCQALGIVSGKKYQAGGGASIRDCFKVIETYSKNLLTDITRFAEWIIFNYLIGNTDAHAKNISLLHAADGIKLAPFYDLLSTEVYPAKIMDRSTAMLINGKGKYDSLRPRDFAALFEQLGLNATNMMKNLKKRFSDVIVTAANVREELLQTGKLSGGKTETNAGTEIYSEIISIIARRWEILNS